MRKLFARVTGSVSGGKRDNEPNSYDDLNLPPAPLSPGRLGLAEESKKHDLNCELILVAARALLAAVQEILYDTASLQENMSGFERLLSILNEKTHDNLIPIEEEDYLTVLLSNMKHPLFSVKCNEVGLATALMHTLRLLRMYEIKLAKSNIPALSSPKNVPQQGVTFFASQRLCSVFSTLLADHRSTEKIRQSLVKLMTFPLSALPERGKCDTLFFNRLI
jgi:hypothetical protein